MARYFNEEEKQEARDVNVVELLIRLGVPLKKCGREYQHPLHDSLKISEQQGWKWFSKGDGGNAVDYLERGPDFKYDFHKAVELIRCVMELDNKSSDISKEARRKTINNYADNESRKELMLPKKHFDYKRISAYLNRTRGIDYEFINRCIKNGSLYESADKHNAVFVGRDFEGKERYACQRGTKTFFRFIGDVGGADKSYNFRMEGNSKTLRVFECPIDSLSYITLDKMNGHKCNDTLLSLGCVSLDALKTYLKESGKEVDTIAVCTDNDAAGKGCYSEILAQYAGKYNVIDDRPKGLIKDYNELLLKEIEIKKGFSGEFMLTR